MIALRFIIAPFEHIDILSALTNKFTAIENRVSSAKMEITYPTLQLLFDGIQQNSMKLQEVLQRVNQNYQEVAVNAKRVEEKVR